MRLNKCVQIDAGGTVWFFGRPGAGKTTAAKAYYNRETSFYFTPPLVWIDGDDVRARLNKDLGYDEIDAGENIRRIAEICQLLNEQGIDVVVSVVAPKRHMRNLIRNVIENVELIWVDTPWDIVYKRRKELYDNHNVLDFENPDWPDNKIKGYGDD